MTSRNEPSQAQGKSEGAEVKRPTAETLFSPVVWAVPTFDVWHQHAPPFSPTHAVLQNVIAVQAVVMVVQIHGARGGLHHPLTTCGEL